MFTLQITLENRRKETKEELFYTRSYRGMICTSKDKDCAKRFKSMASARNVSTRLYKKFYRNLRFEMTGYEISIIEKR